jgi:hypothetical protein
MSNYLNDVKNMPKAGLKLLDAPYNEKTKNQKPGPDIVKNGDFSRFTFSSVAPGNRVAWWIFDDKIMRDNHQLGDKGCYYFPGTTTDYFGAPAYGTGSGKTWLNDAQTVSAWFFPQTSSVGDVVSSLRSISGGRHNGFVIETNSTNVTFILFTNESTSARSYSTGFKPNAWNHAVMAWDSTGLECYLNGKLVYRLNTAISFEEIGTRETLDLDIGRYNYLDNKPFKGFISEVKIFDSKLDYAEIKRLNNNVATKTEPVAHWVFDNPSPDESAKNKIAGGPNLTPYGNVAIARPANRSPYSCVNVNSLFPTFHYASNAVIARFNTTDSFSAQRGSSAIVSGAYRFTCNTSDTSLQKRIERGVALPVGTRTRIIFRAKSDNYTGEPHLSSYFTAIDTIKSQPLTTEYQTYEFEANLGTQQKAVVVFPDDMPNGASVDIDCYMLLPINYDIPGYSAYPSGNRDYKASWEDGDGGYRGGRGQFFDMDEWFSTNSINFNFGSSTDFSVAYRFKTPKDFPAGYYFHCAFCQGGLSDPNTSKEPFNFYVRDNRLYFVMDFGRGTGSDPKSITLSSDPIIQTDTDYVAVVSMDRDGTSRLFLNGKEVASSTMSTVYDVSISRAVTFGSIRPATQFPGKGTIYEAAVWNKALTVEECLYAGSVADGWLVKGDVSDFQFTNDNFAQRVASLTDNGTSDAGVRQYLSFEAGERYIAVLELGDFNTSDRIDFRRENISGAFVERIQITNADKGRIFEMPFTFNTDGNYIAVYISNVRQNDYMVIKRLSVYHVKNDTRTLAWRRNYAFDIGPQLSGWVKASGNGFDTSGTYTNFDITGGGANTLYVSMENNSDIGSGGTIMPANRVVCLLASPGTGKGVLVRFEQDSNIKYMTPESIVFSFYDSAKSAITSFSFPIPGYSYNSSFKGWYRIYSGGTLPSEIYLPETPENAHYIGVSIGDHTSASSSTGERKFRISNLHAFEVPKGFHGVFKGGNVVKKTHPYADDLGSTSASYVSYGSNSVVFGKNSFILFAWFNTFATNNGQHFFSNRIGINSWFRWRIDATTGYTWFEWSENYPSSGVKNFTVNQNVGDGKWHFIAMVRDYDTFKVYLDGKIVYTYSDPTVLWDLNRINNDEFRFGEGVTGNTEIFTGLAGLRGAYVYDGTDGAPGDMPDDYLSILDYIYKVFGKYYNLPAETTPSVSQSAKSLWHPRKYREAYALLFDPSSQNKNAQFRHNIAGNRAAILSPGHGRNLVKNHNGVSTDISEFNKDSGLTLTGKYKNSYSRNGYALRFYTGSNYKGFSKQISGLSPGEIVEIKLRYLVLSGTDVRLEPRTMIGSVLQADTGQDVYLGSDPGWKDLTVYKRIASNGDGISVRITSMGNSATREVLIENFSIKRLGTSFGIMNGGLSFASSTEKNSLDFDGANDYIDFGYDSRFNPDDKSFVVWGWGYFTGANGSGLCVSKFSSWGSSIWDFYMRNDGTASKRIFAHLRDNSNAQYLTLGNELVDNTWNFFALIIDRQTSKVRWILNDNTPGETPLTLGNISNSSPLYLGRIENIYSINKMGKVGIMKFDGINGAPATLPADILTELANIYNETKSEYIP